MPLWNPSHQEAFEAIDNLEDYAAMANIIPHGALSILLNYVLHNLDKDKNMQYEDKVKLANKIFEMRARLIGT